MILELGSVASLQCLPFDEQQKKKGAGGLGAAFGKEAWGVNFGREFRRIFLGRISADFLGRIFVQNFGRIFVQNFGRNFGAEFGQNFLAEFLGRIFGGFLWDRRRYDNRSSC